MRNSFISGHLLHFSQDDFGAFPCRLWFGKSCHSDKMQESHNELSGVIIIMFLQDARLLYSKMICVAYKFICCTDVS